MEKRPKVSVIIPVYNVEKYIRQCLESVIHQSLLDIEIIVVNDGSPDKSPGIVREYMEKDQRIYLIEKENGGLSSARNAGMRAASGQMVMFLDSDDYLEKNACEKIYEVYKNTHADVIIYGANLFPENPKPDDWLRKKTDTRDIIYRPFRPAALIKEAGGSPFAWNKAYSARFLHSVKVEFCEKVKYGEDLIFCFQTLPAAKKIQFIRDRLYFYRWCRPDSLMNTVSMEKRRLLEYHIRNLHIITRYWYRKRWLKEWRVSFEVWFLYFILPDIMKFGTRERITFLNQVLCIMKKYHLRSRGLVKGLKYSMEFWNKLRNRKQS